jgi:hypothetical protein
MRYHHIKLIVVRIKRDQITLYNSYRIKYHIVRTRINRHLAVLLSDIVEEECTKLKMTITC